MGFVILVCLVCSAPAQPEVELPPLSSPAVEPILTEDPAVPPPVHDDAEASTPNYESTGPVIGDEIDFPQPIRDPWEGFNRGVGGFNHVIMIGVIDPLSRVYRLIVPGPAREALGRAGDNIAYPKRLVANLLQNKWRGAGRETNRFLINTTVGIVGLFDPATSMGIQPSDEDFGQTFAVWGWEDSMYLTLPIIGPSTARDAVGSIPDAALDPASYIFGLSQLLRLNRSSDLIFRYKHFVRTQYDPYEMSKYLWSVRRETAIQDYTPDPNMPADPLDTLQSVLLTPTEPGFGRSAKRCSVRIDQTGRRLPYSLWLRDEPAPLVFILPGLGTHRDGSAVYAIAELLFEHGMSVVSISSSMNFEFIEKAATVSVPGYLPADARDVLYALNEVSEKLTRRHGNRITGRMLLGISLGAAQTLYIATGRGDAANTLVDFDRYLAINAPVQLMYGVNQLDRFYNTPAKWPEVERDERMSSAMLRVAALANGSGLDPSRQIPFTQDESKFLIGLYFRLILRDTIHSSQRASNIGVLKRRPTGGARREQYDEILEYSFGEYFEYFVLPYFSGSISPLMNRQSMIDNADLRSYERDLIDRNDIRVITNENDFLLSDADLIWLRHTFGQRLTLFPAGGHLGNLWRPEVQRAIVEHLATTSSPTPSSGNP